MALDKDTSYMDDFLLALYRSTGADPAVQISMYDVGQSVGLDKTRTATLCEELIGQGMVEIKTLSGGVGITAEGIEQARRLGADGPAGESPELGSDPVLAPEAVAAVQRLIRDIKAGIGRWSLDHDPLDELFTDLKTLDVQLLSPRPKTAIVRACFHALAGQLHSAGAGQAAARLERAAGG